MWWLALVSLTFVLFKTVLSKICATLWLCRFGLTALAITLLSVALQAAAGPCARAIDHAAHRAGVPLQVLWAMALVESGHTVNGDFVPWPWTTNEAGKARRFSSRSEAETHLHDRLAAGVRNIDIGCLQVNYHWHAQRFETPEDMFDPDLNAFYAATYLKGLYRQSGDWVNAIGQYHSRQPERAGDYAQKVITLISELSPSRLAFGPAESLPSQTVRRRRTAREGSVLLAPRGQIVDLHRRSFAILPIRTN